MGGIGMMEWAELAGVLLGAGALSGLLAGLFGVGGGAVMVPVLYQLFGVVGVSEELKMQLAVGTSLAVIVPTSIRSFLAHRARGAVDEVLLRAWALPIVAGVAIGSWLASFAPPSVFKLVFVLVAWVTAAKLACRGKRRIYVSSGSPGGKNNFHIYPPKQQAAFISYPLLNNAKPKAPAPFQTTAS